MLPILSCLLALSLAGAKPAIPEEEILEMRRLLAAAIAEPEGKAMEDLKKRGKAWNRKYDFDSLLAALRQGPLLDEAEPGAREGDTLERFGNVRYGYRAHLGEDSFAYGVDVPEGYDPAQPAPVILDPGHGVAAKYDPEGKAEMLGFFRREADAAGLENALIVRTEVVEQWGDGGLAGGRPEDRAGEAFDAVFRDLATRYAIDLDRVWITGLSQTGYWAWMRGQQRPGRYAGLAPMGAVTWHVSKNPDVFRDTPIYLIHGSEDGVCPVDQVRHIANLLVQRKAPLHYLEVEGGAHNAAVWKRLDEGLSWLKERPRGPFPKRTVRVLRSPRTKWADWLRVDDTSVSDSGDAKSAPKGYVRAEIEGQEVRLHALGVTKVTLALDRTLVDLKKSVKVYANDKRVLSRKPLPSFADTLEIAVEKVDWARPADVVLQAKWKK